VGLFKNSSRFQGQVMVIFEAIQMTSIAAGQERKANKQKDNVLCLLFLFL